MHVVSHGVMMSAPVKVLAQLVLAVRDAHVDRYGHQLLPDPPLVVVHGIELREFPIAVRSGSGSVIVVAVIGVRLVLVTATGPTVAPPH